MTGATQPSTLDAMLEAVKGIPFHEMYSRYTAGLLQVFNYTTGTLGPVQPQGDTPTIIIGLTKDEMIIYAGKGDHPYFYQKPLDEFRQIVAGNLDLESQLANYLPALALPSTSVSHDGSAHWGVPSHNFDFKMSKLR